MMRFGTVIRGMLNLTLCAAGAIAGSIALGWAEPDPNESLIRWCPRQRRSLEIKGLGNTLA